MTTKDIKYSLRGNRGPLLPAILALFALSVNAHADETLTKQVELEPAPAPGAEGYHQPPSLDDIPEGPFGDSVRSGWEAFVNTLQHPEAKRFVGNKQNCGNCHLAGGLAANSAPMWGAWGIYPKYRGKNDHVNTMDERIRGCFTYSMNANSSEAGGPPEADSQVLKDLQAFFFWSAEGAPIGKNLPGRGYAAVPQPPKESSVSRGEEVYQNQCAICHGSDGSGQFADDGRQIFPPLWGAGAYNWGAGMHRINTAAAFIKYNMPFGKASPVQKKATLTDQQAWDVAAFINSHERPQDPRWEGSKASTDERWHTHQCLYNETVREHTLGDGSG